MPHSAAATIVAVPLFFYVASFLSSNPWLLHRCSFSLFLFYTVSYPRHFSCRGGCAVSPRATSCGPAPIFFEVHDNALCKLIILVVAGALPRDLRFNDTFSPHALITFATVISGGRTSERASELRGSLAGNLHEPAPRRLFRLRTVIITPAECHQFSSLSFSLSPS